MPSQEEIMDSGACPDAGFLAKWPEHTNLVWSNVHQAVTKGYESVLINTRTDSVFSQSTLLYSPSWVLYRDKSLV